MPSYIQGMIIAKATETLAPSLAHTLFRASVTGALWTGGAVAVQLFMVSLMYTGSGSVLAALFGFFLTAGVSFLIWLPGVSVAVLLGRLVLSGARRQRPWGWPLWISGFAFVGAFGVTTIPGLGIGQLVSVLPMLSPAFLSADVLAGVPWWHSLLAASLCAIIGLRVGMTIHAYEGDKIEMGQGAQNSGS